MNNLAQFEAIDSALDVYLRGSEADARAFVRAESRLLDACIEAGMDHDHADLSGWAAEYVIAALVAA